MVKYTADRLQINMEVKMTRLFYEDIIDLINTQIEHNLSIVQVQKLGDLLVEETNSTNKERIISLLQELIDKKAPEEILDYLKKLQKKVGGANVQK